MEKARLYLTDGTDSEIWEAKHKQNDLVNFTTRGNISLYCSQNPYISGNKNYKGICAHNRLNLDILLILMKIGCG